MRLSNIFEQDPAQAAAMGANALKKTMGANTSGSMVSTALGKLDQGGAISGPLAKALSPYADALEKILSNPMYRNKFMQMMKQIQTANKKNELANPAVQEDWGSSDGYVLVKAIDDAVAKRGLSPEVIQDEAENLAELYYDNMGYDSPEEAVDRIINTWKLRSSTGKALARMFATDESVQEVGNNTRVNGNAEINRVRKLAGLPEGMVDIEYGVDPKMQKLVDIGHLLRKTLDVGSGVKWDDADFNKAANLADALISIGASFGPKNLKDALKLADMDIAQAQELIAKASNKTNESDAVDESFKVIATHGQVEVRSYPGDSEGNHISILKNGKEVASGDYDFYADSYFISHPSLGKGQKSFNSANGIAQHFSTMKEEMMGQFAEGSMKDAMWKDAERMSREEFVDKWGNENGEFWDNIMGEEIEQVDELKTGTLLRYANKAGKDALSKGIEAGRARDMGDSDSAAALRQKSYKRYTGQKQALGKIRDKGINNETAAMPANHAAIAKKVHKELAAGEQVSAAYGAKIKSAHDMLQKKYGKDWRKKAGITENLGYGYNPAGNTADRTDVNYSQTKQMGDATVTVSATAKSMDELHRVLKLAGIEVDTAKSYAEPTSEPVSTQPAEEMPCGCDDKMPTDVKYSTDKQTLINVLRDKLQKRLA